MDDSHAADRAAPRHAEEVVLSSPRRPCASRRLIPLRPIVRPSPLVSATCYLRLSDELFRAAAFLLGASTLSGLTENSVCDRVLLSSTCCRGSKSSPTLWIFLQPVKHVPGVIYSNVIVSDSTTKS